MAPTADDSAEKPPKRNAEECPWYLLATLYGVPKPDDWELQDKNRQAWNRLMAGLLGEDKRAALRQMGQHPPDELTALTPEERTAVEAAFAKRPREAGSVAFPQLATDQTIDFSNLEFHDSFVASGFLFPITVDFSGTTFSDYAVFNSATFSGDTGFEGATFSGDAGFESATFSGGAGFNSATFSDDAWFDSATFSGYAGFKSATFAGDAVFGSATFFGYATFNSATFSGHAGFSSATFSGYAAFNSATFHRKTWFINSEMKSQTSFAAATFVTSPPHFFGAKLHEGTVWHGVTWPPPPRDPEQAVEFVAAYERLKLEMDRLKKHEDELDFFVIEMQSRRVLHGPWKGLPIWLYGILCDHGRSYVRPLYGLLATIGLGTLALWPHFGWAGLHRAIGLSLANTFGILGFRKELVTPETIKALSNLLTALAGMQTVAGAVLLFLFALALRNRFRMR